MSGERTTSELRDPPWSHCANAWDGGYHSIDGTEVGPFAESDVARVLYLGNEGADDWDGLEACVDELSDGRMVAWETWWGPTGSGFCEDAYGGDAEVWFSRSENLATLVLQALTDRGRTLVGIPAKGLTTEDAQRPTPESDFSGRLGDDE